VLDFTSSLYLGMTHPSSALRPWAGLTTGVPAALATPALAGAVAGELARLQGCAAATLARSTLHAFWDLIPMCAGPGTAIYVDAGAYPVARWATERAALRGIPVRTFPHFDAAALRQRLRGDAAAGLRPVVISDGVCPGCGRAAPAAAYLDAARRRGGLLVLDDSQALGLLGRAPGPGAPFGSGGGGSLRRSRIAAPEVVLVASMAKSLGVPMAVISGDAGLIGALRAGSATGRHCSPPSMADLHAAEHALADNRRRGDRLRLRLARLVELFQSAIRAARPDWLGEGGAVFPVQTLRVPPARAWQVHEGLLRRGVLTALHRGTCRRGPAISFVITVTHTPADIERAAAALLASAAGLA
jgi:8-amino-7-oxononanoate synthase